MMRNKKTLKAAAIFFAVNLVTTVFYPTVSWALTAGPTAPEYSSFEPVDTTDMVNLSTGDFTYNIPLLEVPGPEGGYPLSLSYHAGIQPNQEASWVGLGWTLNPGAINRTVNGYPDDFKDITRTVNDYWSGGERTSLSVGLGVGPVNFGLTFAQDTYEGFGTGMNYNVSVGGNGVGVNAGISAGPYGGANASLGVGISAPIGQSQSSAFKASAGIGISTNFNSTSYGVSGGISTRKGGVSILGASISSASLKPSYSVGGMSMNQVNSNAGKMTVTGDGFNVSIPVGLTGVFINIGYNYQRYYSSESSSVDTYGVLHAKHLPTSADDYSFDSYALMDPTSAKGLNGSADKQLGGSFPAYDNYNVTGQGVSGTIQPYIFENGRMYRQNLYTSEGDSIILFKNSNRPFTKKVNFRFKNDFSNAYTRDDPSFPSSPTALSDYLDIYDNQENYDTTGFDTTDNHLAGSKHIEWFTNTEIATDAAYNNYGFIPYSESWSQYKNGKFVGDQVGGFMITNESGVTYHYGLPVYTYDEYSKSQIIDQTNGNVMRQNFNAHPYAYTWLLTAVTGPDYVDRNNEGLDDTDWGYWVKFDYGLWTDDYPWRNPGEGMHKDLDRKYEYYSRGTKDIYYLDAITTRSHTAVFQKSIRHDAKSVSDPIDGGYAPHQMLVRETLSEDYPTYQYIDGTHISGDEYFYDVPVASLKLDKIYLLKNETLDEYIIQNTSGTALTDLKEAGDKLDANFTYSDSSNIDYICSGDTCNDNFRLVRTDSVKHYGDNIVDVSDFSTPDDLANISLRVIDFETDYELCDLTANSFDEDEIYVKNPTVSPQKYGKLTLQKLRFRGLSGKRIVPPTYFGYSSINPDYDKEKYDNWGLYKSDYEDRGLSENIERATTLESAANLSAWCLTDITTSIGAKIKVHYEPDEYNNVALHLNSLMNIEDAAPEDSSSTEVKLTFYDAIDFKQATELDTGDVILFKGLLKYKSTDWSTACAWNQLLVATAHHWEDFEYYVKIKEVDSTFLIVESINDTTDVVNSDLYDQLSYVYGEDQSYDCDSAKIGSGIGVYDFTNPASYIGGNLIFDKNISIYGGGLRVSKIDVDDGENIYSTLYSYSKGTTSYEPVGMEQTVYTKLSPSSFDELLQREKEVIDKYEEELFSNFSELIAIAREVPAPGVFYEEVIVQEKITDAITTSETQVPGYKKFTFEVYNGESPFATVERVVDNDDTYSGTDIREVKFRDYSNRVGILKATAVYDRSENLLSKSTYTYLHHTDTTNVSFRSVLDTVYANQGRTDQLFHEYRYAKGKGKQLIISKKEEYPIVQVAQETMNAKTGIITQTENLEFDFYTGRPLKTRSTDPYGNVFVSVSTPAYHEYSGMGLKVHNISNRHMLTQNAAKYTYKVDEDDNTTNIGLVTASVQTWSDEVPVYGLGITSQSGIWRPYRAYNWIGTDSLLEDGTHPISDFNSDQFTYWDYEENPSGSSYWQLNSEVTLYDTYSHALEEKDINGNYGAVRFDNEGKKVIVAALNASREEIAYSGAEGFGLGTTEGGVSRIQGNTSSAFAHTGKHSLEVEPGESAFYYSFSPDSGKVYYASVWVYLPGASENEKSKVQIEGGTEVGGGHIFTDQNPVVEKKAGEWYLLSTEIEPDTTGDIFVRVRVDANATRSVYFDDFRVSPIDASITTYVYDEETDKLEYILNNDNLYTRFRYDASGRLVATYQEIFHTVEKKVGKQVYHFGEPLK